MKLFLILFISQLAFGVTGNKVWRVPNSGSLPAWGPVNLADATNAVTGVLPYGNMASNVSKTNNFGGGTYTITTSLADISNSSFTFTSTGKDLEVWIAPTFGGSAISLGVPSGACSVSFYLNIDGSNQTGNAELRNDTSNVLEFGLGNIHYYASSLSVGAHTIKLQAQKTTFCGTVTIFNYNVIGHEF